MLISIAEAPEIRLRDVANRVGITERAALRIVSELESAGFLSREKEGRRNRYSLRVDARFRHPFESDVEVGRLLDLFVDRHAGDEPAEPS